MIDVVCFYDWFISLDQEITLIYPAPWTVVKAAYIFCRYFPMAVAPFHLWGLVGNHEQRICESYYRAIYAYVVGTMKKTILAVLSIIYLGLAGVVIWVLSKELTRLCRRSCL
ncbi:hypothetical protein H4582DRAFT_2064028 [Lactarius indigo]|nr:hypothetical protein H4582DRAFT_2064028 [Lactarius indigo]